MVNAANTSKNISKTTSYAHELDSLAYDGDDLGATYTEAHTVFKVWAPTASHAAVKFYKTGSSEEIGAQSTGIKEMDFGDSGVWSVDVDGDLKNTYYTYLITVDGVTRETVDIYAKATGVNGNRGMVVDLDSTDPEGWENDEHILYDDPTDAVVWEVHVKDFSNDELSGISVQYQGKYLAFTENGTTLNNEGKISTCTDYLKQLGVTHVQLLPVYDYATVDEAQQASDEFNWGYDPKNYNVPEGSYSTDPYNGNTRITEFKKMVMALHNAGIGVIMDVVYNHTYTAENSWFEYTVPGYYYRMNDDGTFSDASGCGNETASDRLMYRKYMIDSIIYWATEYHIDGFRFDLMGVHDVTTMNEIRSALDELPNGDKIIMYGEPWTGGTLGTTEDTAVQKNVAQLNNRIGAFNDIFRDAVKGHVFDSSVTGFIQDGSNKNELMGAITANSLTVSSPQWAIQPSQAVAYLSAHVNNTLYDKLVMSVKGDESYTERDDNLIEMNKLAAAITLTSQGTSFMQAGEEFARTKLGDENSFISSAALNQLDWSSLIKYADLCSYYAGLIEIRKNYKPFRDPTTQSAGLISYSDTESGVIAYTLENTLTKGREWSDIAVIFNSNDSEASVSLNAAEGSSLPSEWVIIADKSSAGLRSLGEISGNTVTVASKSALILADKASFERLNISSDKCCVRVEYRDSETDELIEAQYLSGTEGSAYVTSRDESLDTEYDFNCIVGNAEGIFTREEQTVIYYYDKFDGAVCSLTINYLKEGNKILGTDDITVAESVTVRLREGEQYTASVKEIDGLELDLSMFPSNAAGIVGTSDIEVNYYYKTKETADLIIHYCDANNWENVGAYVYRLSYDGTRTSYTEDPIGTKMEADTELGDNRYTITLSGIGNKSDIYVKFTDMKSQGLRTTVGYSVNNEVWIENGTVSYTGKVNVIYLGANGEILETNVLIGKEGEAYSVHANEYDGLVLTASTSNSSGEFSSSPIYVIYSYSAESVEVTVRNSTFQIIMLLMSSGAATLAVGILLSVLYGKRKKYNS